MSRIEKINRKWMKLRLQPVHVFCLHHACEHFDAESMHKGDWMALDEFKKKVLAMQQSGVQFILLSDAHNKLVRSLSPFAFRLKKYAVLTFDDGYASLKEILPWLKEQGIPVTLFINGKYTDGVSYRTTNKEQYMTWKEIMGLDYDTIEIGHHGWEHLKTSAMSMGEFMQSLAKNVELLRKHPRYVSFYAYPYGNYTLSSNGILKDNGIIPVYVNGMKNYNDATCIHRELLDNYKSEK